MSVISNVSTELILSHWLHVPWEISGLDTLKELMNRTYN